MERTKDRVEVLEEKVKMLVNIVGRLAKNQNNMIEVLEKDSEYNHGK